ncbi:MAG: hypothetical protein H7Z75_06580 [Ferruginibacter sp.]|nr:hypothetical protein [Cytophagales bacterium]
MRKLFILLAVMVGFLPAHSQSRPVNAVWQQGSLVLNNGLELNGAVCYDPVTEVVQFRTATMVKAFTARQVRSFRYLEPAFGMIREFASQDFNPRSSYPRQTFFEVVLRGPLTLLRRHNRFREFIRATEQQVSGRPGFFDYVTGFTYYVRTEGRFLGIKQFKKEILPLMTKDCSQEIHQMIEKRKLKLFQLDNQVWLINYYNFLKGPLNQPADEYKVALTR